jgi:ATP-binding cassette, subfamily B, bacterial
MPSGQADSVAKPSLPGADEGLSNGAVVRRLLWLAWRYRWSCLLLLVMQFLLMAMSVTMVQFGGIGIDLIRFHVGQIDAPPTLLGNYRLPSSLTAMTQVGIAAGAMALTAIVRAVLNWAYALISGDLVHRRIVVNLRAEVYAKLQRLSLRFYDQQATGSIINRVTGDVQATRTFIDGVLIQLSVLAMSLVVYLTFLLRIHVGLTILCLATTPFVWWLSLRFAHAVRPLYDATRQRVDDLVLRVAESADGVLVIKSLGRQQTEIDQFEVANDRLRDQQQAVFHKVSRFAPMVQLMTQINLVILLIYGGHLVATSKLSLGTGMIVFAGLLQQFSNQVANLSGLAGTIQQSMTGARRVFEVLDAAEEVRQPSNPWQPRSIRGEIRIEGVWFGYKKDTPVLRDVSLSLKPGDRVGILGGVGQGKSTLLSLIPRFYDPQCGIVSVDGVNVRQWDLQLLRRSVGLVLQEPLLLSNTIAANIAFGRPDATPEQIRLAARLAAAHDFIEASSQGYETILGEYGMSLSGGQRQRLALARALLTDPAILLLDDPVSAIDPETEHEIMSAIDQATQGRTTLIVASRLSTLRHCDYVVVLDEGAIAQEGTHEKLIAEPGIYRDIAINQGQVPFRVVRADDSP